MESANYRIISIYEFFIKDCLTRISKIPLEYQLVELYGAKIVVFDFCGMISKLKNKFNNCESYIIDDVSSTVLKEVYEISSRFDVVYIIKHVLQDIVFDFSCIEVVCSKNSILETIYR